MQERKGRILKSFMRVFLHRNKSLILRIRLHVSKTSVRLPVIRLTKFFRMSQAE